MLIDRISRARLAAQDELCDVVVAGGVVVDVVAHGHEPAVGESVLDADGRVVAPAFVDAHVHLDKAFLPVDDCEPRLDDAIATVDRARATTSLAEMTDAALRAVDVLVRNGTVAARVHAEVVPQTGLTLLAAQLELVDAVRDRCMLQLVAFPQLGLELAEAAGLLGAAMELGTPVIGGCPYVDTDPARHLDVVFGLADVHQCPVDIHLDFGDVPQRSQLDLVIERTEALGLQGRVVISHVTTLAAMAVDAQARTLDRLAAAGIALVIAPVTDLYLGGHGEPGTRSLAPLERALAAGVRVAVATNNLHNPFAPYGNGSLLHASWLAGITRRMSGYDALIDAISTTPADLLGLAPHGPTPGAVAHLVVLDTRDAERVAAQCPAVVATVRSGIVVDSLVGVASGAVK
jgi:cytosine deaminase